MNQDTNCKLDDAAVLNVDGLNYVKLIHGENELKFLLDSGASVSVIFPNSKLVGCQFIDRNRKIAINGIAGSTISQGACDLKLKVNDIEFNQEFLLIDKFASGIDGIIGSNFFTKHNAIIDYEKYLFSFYVDDWKIAIPIESSYEVYTEIPARCEIIKYCYVKDDDEYVVFPEELCQGVYVAAALTKSRSSKIPVKILNVRDEDIKIKNFKPKLDKSVDYYIFNFDNNPQSVNRVDRLLNNLDMRNLNKEEEMSIQKICAKYSDVFYLENDPLTVTNIYKQSIKLQNNTTPVYRKPYRLPQSQKSEIHTQIDKMLKDGIIEEAKSSAWSSPLLIFPKKSGPNGEKKWRIVIDYRELNKQIEDDKFPLPSIIEILDSLSGAMYFSHLDLSQGFYQIEIDPESRPCTAFITDRGHYQMKRLPMGLKISPSSFSRAMTIAMSGLNYESCFVYLDDLIVFGNNLANHNKNLIKVFERMRSVNLKLNPNKCEFLRKEILYLGHVISANGVSPRQN